MAEFECVTFDVVADEIETMVIYTDWSCEEWNASVAIAIGLQNGVLGFAVTPLDAGALLEVPLWQLIDVELAHALHAEALRWRTDVLQITNARIDWEPVLEYGIPYDRHYPQNRYQHGENFASDREGAERNAKSMGLPAVVRVKSPWRLLTS